MSFAVEVFFDAARFGGGLSEPSPSASDDSLTAASPRRVTVAVKGEVTVGQMLWRLRTGVIGILK